MTVIEELRAQRDFLADPANTWVRRSPRNPGECCVSERCHSDGRRVWLKGEACELIGRAIGHGVVVSAWNDEVAKRRRQVVSALDRAIALAEAEEGK